MFNDKERGIGHVDADFDNRRADQHVNLTRPKPLHDLFLGLLCQLAVEKTDAEVVQRAGA